MLNEIKLSDQEIKAQQVQTHQKNTIPKENCKPTKVEIKVLGSLLVALSGLILFSDKAASLLAFELENNYGFADTNTFLWIISQTLSPILLLLASLFKPYKTSYLVPIYIYTIQFVWIFQPSIKFDNYYLHLYAIGACSGYFLLGYILLKINSAKNKQEKELVRFQKETRETIELLKKEILATSK